MCGRAPAAHPQEVKRVPQPMAARKPLCAQHPLPMQPPALRVLSSASPQGSRSRRGGSRNAGALACPQIGESL